MNICFLSMTAHLNSSQTQTIKGCRCEPEVGEKLIKLIKQRVGGLIFYQHQNKEQLLKTFFFFFPNALLTNTTGSSHNEIWTGNIPAASRVSSICKRKVQESFFSGSSCWSQVLLGSAHTGPSSGPGSTWRAHVVPELDKRLPIPPDQFVTVRQVPTVGGQSDVVELTSWTFSKNTKHNNHLYHSSTDISCNWQLSYVAHCIYFFQPLCQYVVNCDVTTIYLHTVPLDGALCK